MINKNEQTDKKLRGGYYTPKSIAKYLWNWVNEITPQSLLEPAAGDGALLEPIDVQNIKIDAVELYQSEILKIKSKSIKGNVRIFNDDFFQWFKYHSEIKYDAILSNPPYIRYQYLTEEQRDEQSEILSKSGMKPNKLINAWVAFVTASINLLREGGRIGLVIPSDFLQVTYAKQLRNFISEEFSKINIVTFKNSVFPGTQQDFIILLGEKGKGKVTLKYSVSEDISNLPNFNYISPINLPSSSSSKWSDLKLSVDIREKLYKVFDKTISFNEVAKIEVGVTTGGNEIFSLTRQIVDELNASKYVVPLLGRSVNVQKMIFDQETLINDEIMGQKVWLLNLVDYDKSDLPSELQEYLNMQEKLGKTNAYKLRIRDNWYQIPGIWIPDAFMLRRIGSLPKLIINGISATSTDTFHRVTFKNDVDPMKIIFSFYSSITLSSIELSGRLYGGGALEILPGDTKDIRIPKIDFRKNNIDLSNEFLSLNSLFEKNKSVFEIAEFADKILNDRLDYKFNSKTMIKILNQLQSLRM